VVATTSEQNPCAKLNLTLVVSGRGAQAERRSIDALEDALYALRAFRSAWQHAEAAQFLQTPLAPPRAAAWSSSGSIGSELWADPSFCRAQNVGVEIRIGVILTRLFLLF